MSSSRRSSRMLVVVSTVLVLLGACSSGERPAAVVGGAEITSQELQRDIVLFRFLSSLSQAPCGTALPGESDDAACARFTLTNDIREELVKAYATEHDLAVATADVDSAIAQLEGSLGGEAVLTEQLQAQGLERSDLEVLARRLLLFNEVQTSIVEERIDDAALRAIFEEQQDQFASVEVSHILLAEEAEAQDVAAEVTPENFAQIASERSIDPGSAPNGGTLGSFSVAQFRQQFIPEFVEAALSLEPGQISGPVASQFGWHVIMLVRRDIAAYEDVKEQLLASQSGQTFEDWFAEQLEATDIDVNPRFGRLDEATGEVVPVRSTAGTPGAETGPTAPTGSTAPAGPTAPTGP